MAEAEDLCRKAIALDATRPEAYLNLARLYNARHASDMALRALRKALPEGKVFSASAFYQQLQADICVEQGAASQAKGMAAQSIEAYARALGFDPTRAGVHRQLAELYLRRGDSARAIEHATAAEKLGTPWRLITEPYNSMPKSLQLTTFSWTIASCPRMDVSAAVAPTLTSTGGGVPCTMES